MITTSNLSKKYSNNLVLNIENLDIPKGQSFGLVGNNGAGKTTYFSLLLDLIQPTTGHIKNKDIFARIGGDEFVLVVNEFDSLTNIDMIVQRVIDLIEEPIKIDEEMVQVGAAIGIAFRTKTLNTVDRLLNAADAAMYIAKEDKANKLSSYHYYNDEVVLKNNIGS